MHALPRPLARQGRPESWPGQAALRWVAGGRALHRPVEAPAQNSIPIFETLLLTRLLPWLNRHPLDYINVQQQVLSILFMHEHPPFTLSFKEPQCP